MFKVICIDASKRSHSIGTGFLVEGEIYTVTGEFKGIFPPFHVCYQLEEADSNELFDRDRFIPISNQDETEILSTRGKDAVSALK